MESSPQRLRLFPRPRLGSRGRRPTPVANNMVELETLSAFSALEQRAVALSQDEIQVCSRLAELLLADALKEYEQISHQVVLQQWKLVKKKDQLGVYKRRKDAVKISTGQTPGQCAASETDLPLLLVTGHLTGHVNDAMYGLVSANTRDMKMNSAYAGDSLEDAQVLAKIEGPTIEEPFRFLGLKWAVRHDAISGSSFVKRRDILYLEATGVTKMANGERVGYRVMHSVSIKALSQLAAASISSLVIRARASIVQLFHEQPSSEGSGGNAGRLNVFTRGYYDPRGGMLQFLAVNAGAELLLHMTFSVVDCAHLKKIAFAAQRAGQGWSMANYGDGMEGIEEIGDEDAYVSADKAWSTNCSLCDRRVGSLLNRSGAPCTVCAKMVCSRCSVVKKLHFSLGNDDGMVVENDVNMGGSVGVQQFEQPEASRASTERTRSSSGSGSTIMNDTCQKALKFCLPCVLRATHRNASQIVVEELLEQTSSGLITPRSILDYSSSRFRLSSTRRRSTQTGRPHNLLHSPHESLFVASPYYRPRRKAYSSAAYAQHGVYRSSAASPRITLYVEDPASNLSGYNAV